MKKNLAKTFLVATLISFSLGQICSAYEPANLAVKALGNKEVAPAKYRLYPDNERAKSIFGQDPIRQHVTRYLSGGNNRVEIQDQAGNRWIRQSQWSAKQEILIRNIIHFYQQQGRFNQLHLTNDCFAYTTDSGECVFLEKWPDNLTHYNGAFTQETQAQIAIICELFGGHIHRKGNAEILIDQKGNIYPNHLGWVTRENKPFFEALSCEPCEFPVWLDAKADQAVYEQEIKWWEEVTLDELKPIFIASGLSELEAEEYLTHCRIRQQELKNRIFSGLESYKWEWHKQWWPLDKADIEKLEELAQRTQVVAIDWDDTITNNQVFATDTETELIAELIADRDYAQEAQRQRFEQGTPSAEFFAGIIAEAEKRGTLEPGTMTLDELTRLRQQRAEQAFDSLLAQNRSQLFKPGVEDLLRKLHELGVSIYVISRGTMENKLQQAKKLGLREIVTKFYVDPEIDKQTILTEIARDNSIDPSQIIMIGDNSASDIEPAKAAGAIAIGFAENTSQEQALFDSGADLVIGKHFAPKIIAAFEKGISEQITLPADPQNPQLSSP